MLDARLAVARDERAAAAPRPAPVAVQPALGPHELSTAVASVGGPADVPAGAAAEEEGIVAAEPSLEDAPPPVDEAAESAFLAEARERGETVTPQPPAAEPADEVDPKALPRLDELVERIPPEVREALEDLFRARFVSVKKIPRKALKS